MDCLNRLWGGYFFDLDGTLVDTAPDLHRALNHSLRSFGYKDVEEDLARRFIGHGALVMIERAIQHQEATAQDTAPILDAFLDYYAQHICVASKPYQTVEDTLHTLKGRGAKIAIVTNKRKQYADLLAQALGWSDLFDCIVGGDTAEKPKPAADPVHFTCDQLALDVDDILFVGDSATDVGAARAAGVPVAVVKDGYNEGMGAQNLGADAVIDLFSELIPA